MGQFAKLPFSKYVGLITAAVGAVGVIKTLIEIGAGKSLSFQQVAFFLGAGAVAVYIGLAAGVMVGGGLAAALEAIGLDPERGAAASLAIAVGGVVGIGIIVVLVTADVLFNYEDTDGFGRGSIALIGIAAVGGGIALYRSLQRKEKADAERSAN